MQKLKLRNYQLETVKWADNKNYFGLFFDMRLGKNLTVCRIIKRKFIERPILFVCSNYISMISLENDLKLENLFDKTVWITGSREERLDILRKEYSNTDKKIFITNKEICRSVPEIKDYHWNCVIIDESRFLANPKSIQSKFYVNNFRSARYRIILTGTPDYKEKLDYYQQIAFLNSEFLPYKNYWDFRNKAFNNWGFNFVIRPNHKKILEKCLAKNTQIYRRKNLKIGRIKTYKNFYVLFTKAIRKKYDVMENEFIKEGYNEIKATIYKPESYTWMCNLTGGFLDGKFIFKNKLNKLKSLLNVELKNFQVIITCKFIQEIKYLKSQIKSSECIYGAIPSNKRKEILLNFQKNKFKYLIVEAQAIAHGVDLKNAKVLIHYSQPKSKEIRDQVEDRIITVADKEEVLIIDLLVKDTIEEDIRSSFFENKMKNNIFERAIQKWKRN